MVDLPLKDVLISARQESHRMRHFYLGVEHLLIALLTIRNGITSTIMMEYGLSAEYVIDAIRLKIGKGGRHRLWTGMPTTPRAEVVLSLADEIARENGRMSITQRDLLIAILEESDSVPLRVLRSLGIDIQEARKKAQELEITTSSVPSLLHIDISPTLDLELTRDQLYILRSMFSDYIRISIESHLNGGYSDAVLMVVRPYQPGGGAHAPVVVKLGPAENIVEEYQRYERYVKATLPILTSRVEERPTAPDGYDIAGLRYTFVVGDDGRAHDLRDMLPRWSGNELGHWLNKHLYMYFRDGWWSQSRPYLFEVWQEYDWLLPPLLTIQCESGHHSSSNVHEIRYPVKRQEIEKYDLGDAVIVENFVVQKINREQGSIRLVLGQGEHHIRAYQIEVHGINFDDDTYYRGEVVERIAGHIWQNRRTALLGAVMALEPDFEFKQKQISFANILLPNPLIVYDQILDMTIDGTLSTIHGDLHCGNVLLGPANSALLIDFEHTREGHTLFDWATLELSLYSEYIAPMIGEGWEPIRQAMGFLIDINQGRRINASAEIAEALQVILTLRQIVAKHLANPDHWGEYYTALLLVTLRAITWETMPVGSRRLAYVISALSAYEMLKLRGEGGPPGTASSTNATDFITNGPD